MARGVCEFCKGEDCIPCCDGAGCDPAPNSSGISSCIHCYGELREVNGRWYHHTQFDSNNNLISPERPQAFSENKARPQE